MLALELCVGTSQYVLKQGRTQNRRPAIIDVDLRRATASVCML